MRPHIKLRPTDPTIAENHGVQVGFHYTLLDEELRGMHPPLQCKDFFQDIWWAEHLRRPISIYGFTWQPGRLDMKAPRYRMALTYRGAAIASYLEPLAAFIHEWEERVKFPRSELALADTEQGPGTAILVVFPREWTEKPILLSAYTLFLRAGVRYHPPLEDYLKNPRTLLSVDKAYLTLPRAQKRLQRMLKGDTAFQQSWTDFSSTLRIHAYSGLAWWEGE